MANRTRSELISVLEQSALFRGLTRRQLNAVAKACFEQHFEPGDVIVRENDYGQRMVTMLSGDGAGRQERAHDRHRSSW